MRAFASMSVFQFLALGLLAWNISAQAAELCEGALENVALNSLIVNRMKDPSPNSIATLAKAQADADVVVIAETHFQENIKDTLPVLLRELQKANSKIKFIFLEVDVQRQHHLNDLVASKLTAKEQAALSYDLKNIIPHLPVIRELNLTAIAVDRGKEMSLKQRNFDIAAGVRDNLPRDAAGVLLVGAAHVGAGLFMTYPGSLHFVPDHLKAMHLKVSTGGLVTALDVKTHSGDKIDVPVAGPTGVNLHDIPGIDRVTTYDFFLVMP